MTNLNAQDFLQILISALITGSITAFLAKRKGRDVTKWFIGGMFFGIFAFLLLVFLPKIESEEVKPLIVTQEMPIQEMPIESWYYLDAAHNTLGPITLEELKKISTPRTYVWKKGLADWTRFEDVK